MAQIQPAVDTFINDIKSIEKSFNKKLYSGVRGLNRLSETELINSIAQLNLFNELIEEGYGEALDNLENEYGKILQQAIREAEKRGVRALSGAGVQGLEVLKDLNTETLLGKARDHSNTLTTQIFQNLYGGVPVNQIIQGLEAIPLATHQLNVATYTGIKTFDDMARYKVFEGADVKWTYVGPDDDKTRKKCKETIDLERKSFKKGFTEKQVSDLDTPFGERGGFNCRHSWQIK
tara:strand:+ start:149 stop:850 length:702 start_codon:yes stop_codon:yes gene_type:complete